MPEHANLWVRCRLRNTIPVSDDNLHSFVSSVSLLFLESWGVLLNRSRAVGQFSSFCARQGHHDQDPRWEQLQDREPA